MAKEKEHTNKQMDLRNDGRTNMIDVRAFYYIYATFLITFHLHIFKYAKTHEKLGGLFDADISQPRKNTLTSSILPPIPPHFALYFSLMHAI